MQSTFCKILLFILTYHISTRRENKKKLTKYFSNFIQSIELENRFREKRDIDINRKYLNRQINAYNTRCPLYPIRILQWQFCQFSSFSLWYVCVFLWFFPGYKNLTVWQKIHRKLFSTRWSYLCETFFRLQIVFDFSFLLLSALNDIFNILINE